MTILRERGLAACGALAVLLATLSGCGTDTPVEIPTQQPTSTPIFASDEEALAAAQEAYAAYLSVSDEVFRQGGGAQESLNQVAIGSALAGALSDAAEFKDSSIHATGETELDAFTLQSYSRAVVPDETVVAAYACENIENVGLVDREGNSLVKEGRPNLQEFQVVLTFSSERNRLLLSERDPWGGGGVC